MNPALLFPRESRVVALIETKAMLEARRRDHTQKHASDMDFFGGTLSKGTDIFHKNSIMNSSNSPSILFYGIYSSITNFSNWRLDRIHGIPVPRDSTSGVSVGPPAVNSFPR